MVPLIKYFHKTVTNIGVHKTKASLPPYMRHDLPYENLYDTPYKIINSNLTLFIIQRLAQRLPPGHSASFLIKIYNLLPGK